VATAASAVSRVIAYVIAAVEELRFSAVSRGLLESGFGSWRILS